MLLMTRKKLAGVVLALALAGALSAGVASGVERVRGKVRRRPAPPPPPLAQKDRAPVRLLTHVHEAPAPVAPRREPVEPVAAVQPTAREPREERPSPVERRAEPAPSRAFARVQVQDEPGTDSHDQAHAAAAAGFTSRIPAPMRVGWKVVESVAGRVRLVAEVERRVGFGAPVVVSLSLPPDATLLEGPADFTVPEGRGGDVSTVPYVVGFGAGGPPGVDLVLVAHSEGRSFGAHAEARHAFGRVSEEPPRPVPTGPALPASLMSGAEHGEELP